MLRSTVQAVTVDVEAELRGDHHLVAERCERLADQFFAGVGTVDFGRVEERDAAVMGLAQDCDALGPVDARPVVAAAQRHVAEANLLISPAFEFPGVFIMYASRLMLSVD